MIQNLLNFINDYTQELVKYEIISGYISLSLSLMLVFILLYFLRKYHNLDMGIGDKIPGYLGILFLLILCTCFVCVDLHGIIKAKYAPKVLVLDKVIEWVK